jgi:hypothetical protein
VLGLGTRRTFADAQWELLASVLENESEVNDPARAIVVEPRMSTGGSTHHAGFEYWPRKPCAMFAKSEQCRNRRHTAAGVWCRSPASLSPLARNGAGEENASDSEVERHNPSSRWAHEL